jgi:predicted AlkP superfamily phosphohydrolase/phosphomutase
MFNIFKKDREEKKVVVVGLDGVPHSLLVDYMERGLMPELSELCKKGTLLKMKSTIPEVSSVAWSSFLTGKNPGEHGIFGFMELDKQSYDYTFTNFTSLKSPPLWEQKDVRTIALNIPQTYPARPLNGMMVSGFVALDLKKASYPDRLFEYLNGIGYRIDVNARVAAEDPDAFFGDLFATFDKRKEAIEHLYEKEEWQLFIGTVTETDRLHHFFFDSAREGKHYGVFEKFYRELDAFIGDMARRAEKDRALFMTCSDHGFTPIKTEVYINKWLSENGYLELDGLDGLKGIKPGTKAFCLDPARLYVHRKGRYDRGSVEEKDCASLVEEIRGRMSEIEYNGEKVVKDLFVRGDIFRGPHTEEGPDICLLPHYGFDLKGAVNRDSVFGTSHFRGMHTYDDAHLFMSSPAADVRDMRIEDVAGIILTHLA